MIQRNRHIWIILLCAYVAAVAALCFMKPDSLPEVKPDFWGIPIDKAVHFMMFFPFPIIAYGSFRPESDRMTVKVAVLLLLYGVGMSLAIGTEHIQGRLGYRSEDIHDFYADLIGMSCSAIFTLIYILVKKR